MDKKRVSKAPNERQKEIIEAAMRLFFEKGVYNTSIKDIATAIEVVPGLCYRYFDSKDSLYTVAVEQFVTEYCFEAIEALNESSSVNDVISIISLLFSSSATRSEYHSLIFSAKDSEFISIMKDKICKHILSAVLSTLTRFYDLSTSKMYSYYIVYSSADGITASIPDTANKFVSNNVETCNSPSAEIDCENVIFYDSTQCELIFPVISSLAANFDISFSDVSSASLLNFSHSKLIGFAADIKDGQVPSSLFKMLKSLPAHESVCFILSGDIFDETVISALASEVDKGNCSLSGIFKCKGNNTYAAYNTSDGSIGRGTDEYKAASNFLKKLI